MKKTILLSFFVVTSTFLSCSSDDSDGSSASNYSLPLNNGNYWTYDVDSEGTQTRDSLFISGDIVLNSKNYKKFETRDNLATGFYSSSLRNNGVRKDGSKLLLSGTLSLASGQNLPFNFDLTLDDFVIFNSNASNNQTLNSTAVTGTIQETYNGYPLTIEYSLQSYGGETLNSFTSPNGDAYSNVKSTKIKLNVSVTSEQTVGGFTFPITILAPQDLIVSTLYTAENIGVVYVNTDTSYSINSTVATQFNIPETAAQNQKEYLDIYVVN